MRAHTHSHLLVLLLALAAGCGERPFDAILDDEPGRPQASAAVARASIQPANPAVQPSGAQLDDPGAGFDIRLVRVQPGVHLGTEQACDVVFSGRPEAVEGRETARYELDAAHRMAIKCQSATGEGWADLIFSPEDAQHVGEVGRGRRLRVRLLAADGGYFDYPVVQFVRIERHDLVLTAVSPRASAGAVPNGFDLGQLRDDPARVGTTQSCAVAFADEVDLVRPNDRRRRSYPAGIQNRMTVRCKHAGGEEPADLVFMPAQALAALGVRRGEVIPVRIISRNGGVVDYPILQYAGR